MYFILFIFYFYVLLYPWINIFVVFLLQLLRHQSMMQNAHYHSAHIIFVKCCRTPIGCCLAVSCYLINPVFYASWRWTADALVIDFSLVFSVCYIILLYFVPSQAIVLCFRLHFTKDNITNNTAAATVRQVVTVVFERMVAEDERFKGQRTSLL